MTCLGPHQDIYIRIGGPPLRIIISPLKNADLTSESEAGEKEKAQLIGTIIHTSQIFPSVITNADNTVGSVLGCLTEFGTHGFCPVSIQQ